MRRIGSAAEWRAWGRRGWPLWWSLLFACGGLSAWWIVPQSTQPLQWIGFVYQLIGVLSVVFALRAAASRHEVKPAGARLIKYMCDCPFWRPARTVNLEASPINLKATLTADGLIVPARINASLEERVASLERKVGELGEGQSLLRQRISSESVARAASLAQLASSSELHASRVGADFRRIEVGSLKLSYFGLLWLVLGMIVSFFA